MARRIISFSFRWRMLDAELASLQAFPLKVADARYRSD